ncbi:MAG: hypothetical protein V1484_01995 [bacterium]
MIYQERSPMPHISSKKLKREHLQRLYNEFSIALEKSAKKSWTILEKILKAGLPPRAGRGRWKFLYK